MILILNNQIKLIEHNNNLNKELLHKINNLESRLIYVENEIIKIKKKY